MTQTTVITISVDDLEISSGNIGKLRCFDDILESLRRGEPVREPLFVYWNEKRGKYLVWDGSRRLRAGIEFGMSEFPCIVFQKINNELQALQASIKHSSESLALSHAEIALGVKAVLREYMKTMSKSDARDKIREEFGFSAPKLSRYERIAGINPQLIFTVSQCEKAGERVSGNLWYEIAILPSNIQKEMANHEWSSINDLRGFTKTLRNHHKEFKWCTPKEKVRLALEFQREGYSPIRVNNILAKRAGFKQTANRVRVKQSQTAAAVQAAGNKLPAKNLVSRTLTIGPRIDYWWDANEAVAKLLGHDSLEEHITVSFLDPESVDYWRLYSEKMGFKPTITLGKLRRERKVLERKLTDLVDQIAEMEKANAKRRR